ncbi:MAG: site-specific integrase [Nitrososphaerales archaeon]|nr:site-specific integrase [Nitrososphaerales archaeon]
MTPDDIHDYLYQLRNAESRLERDSRVRPQDKKLIRAFMKQVKAQGVSLGRQAKYVNTLMTVSHHMRVTYRRAKRRDIEDLMTRLADHEFTVRNWDGTESQRHYSAETMADFKIMVKRFMKFVRYGDTDKDTPYPEEVRWLRKTIKASEKQEPLFFTDEEVRELIKAADTYRDKAIISVAAELGARVSELLLLRVGDVQFDDAGAIVHIRRGKTGARTLRLIASVDHLARYLETHRFRTDPNAPLWLTLSPNHLDEPFGWKACSAMIKDVAKKAAIKKPRVHMYMFRHESATRNAKFLTDSELRLMYGWSMSSRTPATYIHLSGGDLDRKYQAVYSGRPVEPPKPEFAPVICPRCKEKASPGMMYCPKCATPLDLGERAKMAVQEESTKREVSELRRLLEKYLRGSDSKDNSTADAAAIESQEEGKTSNQKGPP